MFAVSEGNEIQINLNNDLLIENSNFYNLLQTAKDKNLIDMFNLVCELKQKKSIDINMVNDAYDILVKIDKYIYGCTKDSLSGRVSPEEMNQLSNLDTAKTYLRKMIFHYARILFKDFVLCVLIERAIKKEQNTDNDDADLLVILDNITCEFNELKPGDIFECDKEKLKNINPSYDVDLTEIFCVVNSYKYIGIGNINDHIRFLVGGFLNSDTRKLLCGASFKKTLNFFCSDQLKGFFIISKYILNRKTILTLLSNQDRYNFFLQFHHMLEKNLPDEDKQLFYNYLNSCQKKLQNGKGYYSWYIENNFSWFTRREKQLTAIFIFGIIASAAVLTIYSLEIYAATWFFWFGIVGVVLTVAVGIRLFFCLKENWNDLKELASDLQQEGKAKTIQDKIDEINRAIDVYDLNKIKNLQEPEPEKISTFDVNKNKIMLDNNEINTTKQNNNSPQSVPINTENPQLPS